MIPIYNIMIKRIKMKLCKEYQQVYKGTLYVNAEVDFAYIIVVIKQGANSDGKSKRGLHHICEHIFLKLVESRYLNNINDIFFEYKGHTDYTSTTYEFKLRNKIENINYLLSGISDSLDLESLPNNIIIQSRDEVLQEFSSSNNIKKSMEINSFICEEKIEHIPLGDKIDISQISSNDYFKIIENYKNDIGFAVVSNVKKDKIKFEYLEKYNNDFKVENTKKNLCDSKKNQILDLSHGKYCEILIYKKMNFNVTVKEFISENIFEIYLQNVINYSLKKYQSSKTTMELTRKIVCNDYYFLFMHIFLIENNKKKFVFPFNHISKEDFEIIKEDLIGNLKNIHNINVAYILNNLVNYFLYNDNILVTKESINKLIAHLNLLNYDEFINILFYINSSNYSLVYK